jgi:hypothetical protein
VLQKLKAVVGSESTYSRYFRGLSTHFEIHHYAGKVILNTLKTVMVQTENFGLIGMQLSE